MSGSQPAILALADGTVFRGRAFGAVGEASGELVFNTSMMGYQEILTDPSYEGQLVAMTYPEIGNVGVNRTDVESRRPFVRGFVVREYRHAPSVTQEVFLFVGWRDLPSPQHFVCLEVCLKVLERCDRIPSHVPGLELFFRISGEL